MTAQIRTEVMDRFSHCLLGAQQTAAIYPVKHPRVSSAVRELYLETVNALENLSTVRIAYTGDGLVFGDVSVPLEGDLRQGLVHIFQRREIERLVIRTGVRRWEIGALVAGIAGRDDSSDRPLARQLEDAGVEHINVGQLRGADGQGEGRDTPDPGPRVNLVEAWEAYSKAARAVGELTQRLQGSVSPQDFAEAQGIACELVQMVDRQPSIVSLMSRLKDHDGYSYTHSLNVALLSVQVARTMGVPRHILEQIASAALLHDIGKARTPDEVLNKPGKLTPEEWEVMQQHSADGVKMLVASPDVDDLAAIVAYEHQLAYEHDNPDHGRWPLHYVSEVVCVADVYDALRSKRPYRDALPPDVAMQIMDDEAEAKFNEMIFDGFKRLLGYYPPATIVQLTDSSVAVVAAADTRDPRQPVVLRVRGPEGEEIEPPEELRLKQSDLSVEKVLTEADTDVDPLDYLS